MAPNLVFASDFWLWRKKVLFFMYHYCLMIVGLTIPLSRMSLKLQPFMFMRQVNWLALKRQNNKPDKMRPCILAQLATLVTVPVSDLVRPYG